MQRLLLINLVCATLAAQGAVSVEVHDVVTGSTEYKTISSWLHSQLERTSHYSTVLKTAAMRLKQIQPVLDKDRLYFWQTFVALLKLKNVDFRCTLESVRMLEKNAQYSNLDLSVKTKVNGPVQYVVRTLLIEHAHECESKYVEKFKEMRTENERSTPAIIDSMANRFRFFIGNLDVFIPSKQMKKMFELSFHLMKVKEKETFLADVISSNPEMTPSKVVPHLKEGMQVTMDDVDISEVARLVHEIPTKCRAYMGLYEQVLLPALFDAGTYPGKKGYGDEQLGRGIFNYFFCELLSRVESWDIFVKGVGRRLAYQLSSHNVPKKSDPAVL